MAIFQIIINQEVENMNKKENICLIKATTTTKTTLKTKKK